MTSFSINAAGAQQLQKKNPELMKQIEAKRAAALEGYAQAHRGEDGIIRFSSPDAARAYAEGMQSITKEYNEAVAAGLGGPAQVTTQAATTTPPAGGAKAEVKSEVSVTIQAPQKPAEEGLKFNNGNLDIREQTAIDLGHSEVQRQLAVQEDLFTTLKNNPNASFGEIAAQRAKVIKLQNTISGTRKIAAGDVKNVTDAEKESIKSVDFSSLTVGKATASDEQKKAMKELFVNGLTDESYIGKNIFDDKFGKIDKKPADAPDKKPADAPDKKPAGAPAEKPANAPVDDNFETKIAIMLTNCQGANDMSEIQDYFQMSGSEEQTKIINYLKNIGEVDLANDLENSIKTE